MKIKMIFTVVCAALLVGCGSLVGSGRQPDELAVVSGPPLTLPPNFELRPPTAQTLSQAAALKQQDSSKNAQEILLGGVQEPLKEQSTQGAWLLEKAGATHADPNIRNVLGTELEQADE